MGMGGPQRICSGGTKWPSPYPGHRPAGQAGDTRCRAVPLSLCPSGEGEEDSGLGQAATLYCPIPFSANQNGFEVCLKMKPRYASVFMMLAMFLQSSKRERKDVQMGPTSFPPTPTGALTWVGSRSGSEPDFKLGVPLPCGSTSSVRLGWMMLAGQEAWSQCFSVP